MSESYGRHYNRDREELRELKRFFKSEMRDLEMRFTEKLSVVTTNQNESNRRLKDVENLVWKNEEE